MMEVTRKLGLLILQYFEDILTDTMRLPIQHALLLNRIVQMKVGFGNS